MLDYWWKFLDSSVWFSGVWCALFKCWNPLSSRNIFTRKTLINTYIAFLPCCEGQRGDHFILYIDGTRQIYFRSICLLSPLFLFFPLLTSLWIICNFMVICDFSILASRILIYGVRSWSKKSLVRAATLRWTMQFKS